MNNNFVVLSTTDDPDYMYMAVITAHSWKALGYTPIFLHAGTDLRALGWLPPESIYERIDPIPGFSNACLAQVSRLLGWQLVRSENRYATPANVVTGDADMITGPGIILPVSNQVTVYGADLCDYTEYPMCYIQANVWRWSDLFEDQLNDVNENLKILLEGHTERWTLDQELVTAAINKRGKEYVRFVDRGIDPSSSWARPIGRMDRYDKLKRPPTEIKDVHFAREPWERTTLLRGILNEFFPETNWAWVERFETEFRRIHKL